MNSVVVVQTLHATSVQGAAADAETLHATSVPATSLLFCN